MLVVCTAKVDTLNYIFGVSESYFVLIAESSIELILADQTNGGDYNGDTTGAVVRCVKQNIFINARVPTDTIVIRHLGGKVNFRPVVDLATRFNDGLTPVNVCIA